jgi:putative RecB family exonuclease
VTGRTRSPDRPANGVTSLEPMSGQLGLEGMPTRLVKVTPSRLSTWDDCRRRFRMTYVDQPPPPRGGAWAHSTLGAVVHNALRSLFALPAPRRSPEVAASLVDRTWSDEGFRDRGQAAEYRGRARTWVADYVAEHDTGDEPLGLERWVAAPVGRIVAEGRVDRIDRRVGDRGAEAVVVDYKTGRRADDADGARGSQALALYAIAAARTLRMPCRRVELHHLPTGTVAVAEHDDASLRRHRERAEESATEMVLARDTLDAGGAADALYPPSPGPRCARCDVRRHCPEGRAAAPALEPWALLAP